MTVKNREFLALAIFLLASIIVMIAGGLITASSVKTWYVGLSKPSTTPPDWVFGPVWTVLYTLMAVSAWRVWKKHKEKKRNKALVLYGAQLFLNFMWTVLFFGFHSPISGALCIYALLAAIIYTAFIFYKIDRLSGYFFVPYILWVGYASLLNTQILLLN